MKISHSFLGPVRCALSVALLSAFVVGCSSPVKLEQAPVKETNVSTNAGSGGADGVNSSSVKEVKIDKTDVAAWGKLARVIYFDLDSYVVKDESLRVVEANAKALAADRNRSLVVEGHADERGGREYNLALGQKRAEAVAKSLTVLGASGKQIEAVSFGKERPAAMGTGEAVWALNRRAELNPRQ
jgi:peptidoglycan-associated lipoprotein